MGDGDDADRQKFIANMRVEIPHVLDVGPELWQEYGVHSQPSMVFVDADGNRDRHVGAIDTLDLLNLTTALVDGGTDP